MSTSPQAGPSAASPIRKRHHLDPHEQQARALEKLLAHPERQVHIPAPPREKSIRPPREIQKNVVGSSAGAGSGEFHVYKHARRREYERIKLMEDGANKIMQAEEFARQHAAKVMQDEAKTDKNRAKREKKKLAALKARAAAKGQNPDKVKLHDGPGRGDGARAGRRDSNDGDDDDGEASKRRRIHNEETGGILFRKKGDDDDEEEEGDGESSRGEEGEPRDA
ncbi:uncharacterized protein PFL1_00767 [Pseudozyma flocculosa PF-1]|uniref:DUF1168-domain-containing protein n=1 Tax=Pseudozyma flocculosa TaxID=84751 RepID=A0A5C3F534_9BASI|nr:uncharacterized protein PFL1_00767 [Pseudozyma flocculosa PF-1]EPQ31432.1 hypothetical protein PFL1_00767 [Pseudozyma flocculosa PF-1]SPO38787.1 uncharacterized protein PSFLO_04266 [Pseudozyma flocculosa]